MPQMQRFRRRPPPRIQEELLPSLIRIQNQIEIPKTQGKQKPRHERILCFKKQQQQQNS